MSSELADAYRAAARESQSAPEARGRSRRDRPGAAEDIPTRAEAARDEA